MSLNPIRPWRNIERRKSRQIMVGNVPVGGDAPISVQTMTNTNGHDVRATLAGALEKTFQDPDFVKKMDEMGEFVDYRDGAGYSELAHADSAMAEGVIRDLGMYGMNK